MIPVQRPKSTAPHSAEHRLLQTTGWDLLAIPQTLRLLTEGCQQPKAEHACFCSVLESVSTEGLEVVGHLLSANRLGRRVDCCVTVETLDFRGVQEGRQRLEHLTQPPLC